MDENDALKRNVAFVYVILTVVEAAAEAEPRVSPHTVLRGWERIGLHPHFRGRRRNTTDEEYRRLNAEGHAISEIARIRGEDYDTAAKHCRDLKLRPNRRPPGLQAAAV